MRWRSRNQWCLQGMRSRYTTDYQALDSLLIDGASFNGVSKVVRDYFGFALLRLVIGRGNSPQIPQSDSDAKPKPKATWSSVFFSRLKQFACF